MSEPEYNPREEYEKWDREHQSNDPYGAGRRARQQGCYRALCVATDEERREWMRGWDDEDAAIKQTEAP
jgi:hypothetical protein